MFSLEAAVHKMTGLTAANFGFRDRGVIAEGGYADITIFDPDTVDAGSDYENGAAPARGIAHVLVNGTVAWTEGACTGSRNGTLVRRVAS
jgi:N-acyl-D-amino-acid deacylase